MLSLKGPESHPDNYLVPFYNNLRLVITFASSTYCLILKLYSMNEFAPGTAPQQSTTRPPLLTLMTGPSNISSFSIIAVAFAYASSADMTVGKTGGAMSELVSNDSAAHAVCLDCNGAAGNHSAFRDSCCFDGFDAEHWPGALHQWFFLAEASVMSPRF